MTPIQEIYKTLKFVSSAEALTPEQIKILEPVLKEEISTRETRRIQHLLVRSGLKPIKKLEDFDWKFNPKLPREEIMRLLQTPWDKDIKNVMFIGPGGVGKTHLAKGICYKAIQQGVPTAFITCHDLIGKIKQSRNRLATLQYYGACQVFS
jgi:DNA replication protein DnaC